ncbi:hypothetical protein [Thiothrix subterranea]|uniref:Cytochrome C n=1 Tax=Thiothrix subterranea TaxID=2735563 RepID=A0AA51MMW4_9GAMM|nr:hypothetical protein [Thiothrix subterranea]MDQ5769372.1 hypothetical protein [Thiothrix subterranea]WML85006.1 hypothetical protein RCG00_11885 [Thiothrix subterranea]
MKPYSAYLLAGLLCLSSALPTFAADTTAPDPRTSLGMTPAERAEFLSEMRKMLGSIQGILQGISNEDRKMIAEFATQSGNRMARATPDTLRNRLPQAFKDIGGPTHMLFEELVIRAETDDMEDLLKHTTTIMNQCMSCHAQFRAD